MLDRFVTNLIDDYEEEDEDDDLVQLKAHFNPRSILCQLVPQVQELTTNSHVVVLDVVE